LPAGVDELIGSGDAVLAVRSRTMPGPANAGVYWMRRSGAVVGALVVNAEPAESDLAVLDTAGVAARFAGVRPAVVTTRDDPASVAFAAVSRRPLVGAMLTMLVALLLVETFTAREPDRSKV
jgi:hypothetical protein